MVYTKYYFFNVENPDEIKTGARPRVTQYGPYAYQEYRRKEDIAKIGLDKISYGQYIEYVFDEEESLRSGCFNGQEGIPCKKTDHVLVINSPLVGVIDIIRSLPPIPLPSEKNTTLPTALLNILDLVLFDPIGCTIGLENHTSHCDDLFYNATVDDLLWQGHNPGIIELFFSILKLIEKTLEEKLGIDIDLDQFLPPQLSGRSLAFFKGKNRTKLDNYRVINNGALVHGKYLNIEAINGNTELPNHWWPNIAPTPSAKKSGIKGKWNLWCKLLATPISL